ncbi:Short C-terminal domain-containing protein [Streptomyces pini]|uniref:Short C-terminal domain-containing protein n=2 Tax=Streptomyces pini TaxID=1520580 RepID=A0A1I3YH42_9ACTN|nr:Short C-terminal domain-containing protein [Streptomyces pini]
MTRMGDVLAGINSSWEFDTDSVLIRFERGIRTPKLFHVLGERRVPHEALRSVELTPGTRRGTVVLRAEPRPGADPLMEAAAGQLRETSDPYRLVLPAEHEPLAAAWVSELSSVLGPRAQEPADRHLVAAPAAPLQFKAYDGKVSFDGRTVSFRWFWTGASSAKWKAGDQSFPVGELQDVRWRSPEVVGGHLRLVRRGEAADRELPEPDQDPAAVVFGLGYGLVHESLPLAASVLEAVRAAGPAPVPEAAAPVSRASDPVATVRPAPADIADRIRHLGELHGAGLLTEEEFSAKKAELLAEL